MYEPEQITELKSILAGIFYLAEESYRFGLERIGAILRDSIFTIQADLNKSNVKGVTGDLLTKEDFEELFEFLETIRPLSKENKIKVLKLMSEETLKEIH
jgi:hypothetical protein